MAKLLEDAVYCTDGEAEVEATAMEKPRLKLMPPTLSTLLREPRRTSTNTIGAAMHQVRRLKDIIVRKGFIKLCTKAYIQMCAENFSNRAQKNESSCVKANVLSFAQGKRALLIFLYS